MKKKSIAAILLATGFAISGLGLGACGEKPQPQPQPNVREVDICPEHMRAYLQAEDAQSQYEVLKTYQSVYADYQVIDMEYDYQADMLYRLFCENVTNASENFVLDVNGDGHIEEGWFIPGETYRCRLVGMDEIYAITETNFTEATVWSNNYQRFVVKEETVRIKPNTVRNITMDEGFNYRDLGGWSTGEKTIKYGMIYRGGKTNVFSAVDKQIFTEYLGIKSEIDLRNGMDDGGQTSAILGEGCNYLKTPINQYSYIVPSFALGFRSYDASTPPQLKRIFEFLADENNYPLFFHCNAGADRTGTLAFLLCGYLGVPLEDLTRDFELTTFSFSGARLRGELKTPFEYGIMTDNSNNFVAWGDMIDRIQKGYGTEGQPLSTAIQNYLIQVCGISQTTLDKIADILLQ